MTVTEVQLKGGAGPRQAGVPNWLSGWQGAVLVSTVVTLFTWPGWTRVKPGLDPSWQAGLAIAFTHHLQWGPQLDFTYGPYGFAGYLEPFYRSTALIAVLYVLAVTWLLAFLLVTGLRKYCGLGAAAVIAWAVVWLSWVVGRAADFSLVVGLGLALCIVGSRQPARRAELALLLGALAGFAFLVKLSTGVVLLGLLVAALAGADGPWRERLRTSALAAAVMVGVFTMAWLVAGQTIANLPSFARASVSLVVGYGAAMGGALKDASIAWWALTMALLAAVVFATALRGRPRREQVAVLVLVGGWGWASVKEGFVSGNHFPLFFRVVLAAIALAALAAPPRRLYAGALALAACITLVAIGVPETDPVAGIPSLATDLADLAQPARFALLTGTTRLQLLKDEPVPGSTLALLRGRSVAIEPWEDMVAWADPNLRWDPEPVVQDYSAFTPYLDHLDAHFLSSARAPERILYRPNSFAFDFRDRSWTPRRPLRRSIATTCSSRGNGHGSSWDVSRTAAARR